MTLVRTVAIAAAFAFACASAAPLERPIPPEQLRNGSTFTSEANRKLQADDFENPGMLWVERGAKLWSEPAGKSGKSCASCHDEAGKSLKGAAAHYPRVDPPSARLVNLSDRINLCRERHQQALPYALESDELLAMSAFVTNQSRGVPMNVTIDAHNARDFERGRSRFYRRMGQMNLSCAHCHDRNWDRTLLFEKISQGQPTGFPTYRQEWQTLGSLQRRLRACYSGLRAQMPPYGARELVELELFLAWRANGLPIEAPGVRR
ncbi:MAG TPA: sulfur oxidation c-type cytochrome SoxA [Burkholderiales bacterium]|nr:sulfur oxidation c-type cytochrome SoxA [Burkholderiales bacterium]